MADTLLTSTVILNETMRMVQNKSAFLPYINKQFNDEFAKKGMKAGESVFPRRPVQYTIRSGATAVLQDVVETSEPITIEPEFGIDFDFTDFDLTLKIDQFSERYLKTAAEDLATELDMRIASRFYKRIYNHTGTPGQRPSSSLAVGQANALLTNMGAPLGDRILSLEPLAMANMVDALKGAFNDQKSLSEQFRTGLVKTHLGCDYQSSPNVPVHTVGVYGGTPLSNGATQGSTGANNAFVATTAVVTDGWTATTTVLNEGDIITFAGVNAVNPRNKQDLGYLKQFVVTAATVTDGSGNSTITVSPGVIAGGAYKNVTQRIPDNSAITVVTGASAAVHQQNVLFHPDAFTMVTVDLPIPAGQDMADKILHNGVSLRFIRGYDITNNKRICRFDIMAGFGSLNRDWAIRLTS